jgi:hypothetical protein
MRGGEEYSFLVAIAGAPLHIAGRQAMVLAYGCPERRVVLLGKTRADARKARRPFHVFLLSFSDCRKIALRRAKCQ